MVAFVTFLMLVILVMFVTFVTLTTLNELPKPHQGKKKSHGPTGSQPIEPKPKPNPNPKPKWRPNPKNDTKAGDQKGRKAGKIGPGHQNQESSQNHRP